MRKGGWTLFPAAFFFAVNFAVADVGPAWIQQFAYGAFLIALFALLRRVDLRRLLPPAVAGISLILFAYGLVQKFVLFPIYLQRLQPGPSFYAQALIKRVESGRIFSLFALPTLYALVIGLLLLLIVHYARNARGWVRLGWAALGLAGALNLLLTQSFGGLLGFAAALLLYLLLSGALHGKFLFPLLMALSLVFFVVSALRYHEVRQLQPARLRLANWFQAVRLIGVDPVFGCGLGNYGTSISAHVRSGEQPSLFAHNFFLQLGAETGLPALLLVVTLLAFLLRRHWPLLRQSDNAPYAALLLQLLIYNLIDIGIFFFTAGIATAVTLALLAPHRRRSGTGRLLLAAALPAALLATVALGDHWQLQADLLASQQQYAAAQRLYRRSLACNPYSWRAWNGLAQASQASGDGAAERVAVEQLLRIFPGSASGNYLYSRLLFNGGQYLSALHHAGLARTAAPDNPTTRNWYDTLRHRLQDQLAAAGN